MLSATEVVHWTGPSCCLSDELPVAAVAAAAAVVAAVAAAVVVAAAAAAVVDVVVAAVAVVVDAAAAAVVAAVAVAAAVVLQLQRCLAAAEETLPEGSAGQTGCHVKAEGPAGGNAQHKYSCRDIAILKSY